MAVLTWAVVLLALSGHNAVVRAANQCRRNGDSEGCSDIETPEQAVRNNAALLQAAVGQARITLPDDMQGADGAEEQPTDTRASSAKAAHPASASNDTASNSTPAAAQAEGAVQPIHLLEDNSSAADNTSTAAQPSAAEPASQEQLALVAANVSTVHGLGAASWMSAGSSVLAAAQQTAHDLRKDLPERLVYIFPSMQTDIGAVFGLALASSAIWCTLVVLAACVYRSQKSFPQAVSSRSTQEFEDWTSGPFDFCTDAKVGCWSCWCPCIRWADNMDMLGIVSFWVGLLLFCGLIMLTTIPGGLLLWLVATLLWMSFRQQLRLKFDMEKSTFRTFIGDCALYCCCWPCAIAQEARHIEEACRAAHPALRKFGP